MFGYLVWHGESFWQDSPPLALHDNVEIAIAGATGCTPPGNTPIPGINLQHVLNLFPTVPALSTLKYSRWEQDGVRNAIQFLTCNDGPDVFTQVEDYLFWINSIVEAHP